MRRFLPALLLLSSCSLYWPDAGPDAGEMPDSGAAESGRFRALADAYIAWYHAAYPVAATYDGIHDHDTRLGRYTRDDMLSRAGTVRLYLARLGRIDRTALPAGDSFDYPVLEGHLQAALLDLEKIRPWERNPNFYRNIVSGGLYALSALSFDALERRMALAADRLGDVPAVLADARANLNNPPRLATEVAIDEFGGTYAFLENGLAAAFEGVKEVDLRKRFDEALRPALEAIREFVKWMRQDLLPRSKGEFAIGTENFQAKVLYEEGIATPLEDLLREGYELLRATQDRMKALAGDRPVKAALREASKDHAPAERLLEDTRAMLEDLKRWATEVVDVPASASCRVQETPSFRRSMSFASMEIPGPFEQRAKEAYYSITLPDPSWTPERKEQHLSFFNPHSLRLISVHEAYPGHYTQFLAVQQCSSRVRKVFGSASFSEGWAHYCEELYVEGREVPKELRLQQLSLALLRICRYIAGIEMHTRGMTREQAVELFVNEGYQERANAEREALRGTSDPTYLVYTLGKMEILKLRADYRRLTGRSLREFHNEFLRHGYPPIPVVREILLGERRG